MKIGIQLPSFNYPGGAGAIGPTLADIGREVDAAGFTSLWVMDHFFQIEGVGPTEDPMLEGYSALAYLAAVTRRVALGTLVSGVTYRQPGIFAKTVTTLDVLSGGRAWLGIGAGWYEREHHALGVPYPPTAERFERLEETLRVVRQMWDDGNDGPFEGTHYRLAETMNHPQVIFRPHPPILIGGGGEKRTLRLVAEYADATNLMALPAQLDEIPRKLDVLRGHCAAVGRDYDTIQRTAIMPLRTGTTDDEATRAIEAALPDLERVAGMGIDQVILSATDLADARTVTRIAERVLPVAAGFAVAGR